MQNEIMVQIFTGQIPAPSELLIYVRCGCREDGCGTLTYSCKKNGNIFSYCLSNLLFVSTANLSKKILNTLRQTTNYYLLK